MSDPKDEDETFTDDGVFETQDEAVLDAIEDSKAEGGATVVVCQGPPICTLQSEDAVQNMEDGCPLCKRIIVHPDGTQEEYKEPVH